MSKDEPPGDPFQSQTEHPRCAVEGQLAGGGKCTVVAIRTGGYVLYPHGAHALRVRLSTTDAARLGAFLQGGQS